MEIIIQRRHKKDRFVFQCDDADAHLFVGKKIIITVAEKKFYPSIRVNGEYIGVHRLLTGAVQHEYVDHIDGNTMNNRRDNLRKCTNQQNGFNSRKRPGTTSQYKGVHYYPRANKTNPWMAYIKMNYQRKYLGYFATEEAAARAYDAAATLLFGEFAKLNFPVSG